MATDIKDIIQAKLEAEKAINKILYVFTENTGLDVTGLEVTTIGHHQLSVGQQRTFIGVKLEVHL